MQLQIIKTADNFKSLQGPVYVKGGDQHNFNVITETTDTQKELVGPVYLCEKNQFNVVTPRAEAPKEITGPVYLTEEARHKYAEFVRKVEGRGRGWTCAHDHTTTNNWRVLLGILVILGS